MSAKAMRRPVRLTDVVVASVQPMTKEYAIRDTAIQGFALRVKPTGTKVWTLRIRRNGRNQRMTIGSAISIDATKARQYAYALLTDKPAVEQPSRDTTLTLRAFESIYRKRRGNGWAKETMRSYRSAAKSRILPALGPFQMTAVRRIHVERWFHEFSSFAPGNANKCLQYVKAIFNAAKKWGYLPETHANPCDGVRRNRRPPRGQMMNTAALKLLGTALDRIAVRLPDSTDAIKLLLLTGCRCGEIMSLSWDEVKHDRLALKSSKTGPKTVLLGDAAQRILNERRERAQTKLVFPSPKRRNRPLGNPSHAWRLIKKEAKLDRSLRLHDLRHTYASHAIIGGETVQMAGVLLGHRRITTTAIYTHLQDDHLNDAACRTAQKILVWMEPTRISST